MAAKVLPSQPKFIEYDRRTICSEAATVQSDVEQDVVLELRFFFGGVQEESGIRFLTLDAQLGFDAADLIEPDDIDTVEIERLNDPVELLLRIVPEDDPLVFFVVDFAQGFVELFGIHAFQSALMSEETKDGILDCHSILSSGLFLLVAIHDSDWPTS